MSIHFARLSLVFSMLALPVFAACGNNSSVDADPFDTYEACFTEHHVTEAFSTQKAITICCLDHPIGSNAAGVVCGATAQTCGTYVTANLMGSDATADDITAACTDYVTQKGM
jgi:hypothetical protein